MLLTCRKSAKQLRVELKQQAQELQRAEAARGEAQASQRVAAEERMQMKTEWTEMFSSHDGLRSNVAELQQQIARQEQALQVQIANPLSVCTLWYPCPFYAVPAHVIE